MSYSRYFDNRVHPHFTKIYTKIPYLDTEIYNIGAESLRESRRIVNRTSRATDGIARTLEKSAVLEGELARSRLQRDKDDSDYLTKLSASKASTVIKGSEDWRDYLTKRSEKKLRETREQQYLQTKLHDNSLRAYQRLEPVRRWLWSSLILLIYW